MRNSQRSTILTKIIKYMCLWRCPWRNGYRRRIIIIIVIIIIINIGLCWYHGFSWHVLTVSPFCFFISLAIRPHQTYLLICSLRGIQCLLTAIERKFCCSIDNDVSMYRRTKKTSFLCSFILFQLLFFVLHGLFLRWEVSCRKIIFRVILQGLIQNSIQHPCAVTILIFRELFR